MFSHARQLFKDSSVASIAPTAPFNARQIVSSIDFAKARILIEYGPGDGALTRYLLEKMHPDARLVIIETNDHFVAALQSRFSDPRLTIVHDSAENAGDICRHLGISSADYIVSGIPYSLISDSARDDIMRESARLLAKDGKLIIYQALTAISARRAIKNTVRKYFLTGRNRTYFLNLPPLYVFEAERKS